MDSIEAKVKNLCMTREAFLGWMLLTAFVFMVFGYAWRMHHDSKIRQNFQTNAEQQVANIAESFADGREFVLFGIYRIYPVKGFVNRFNYQIAGAGADTPVREGEQ